MSSKSILIISSNTVSKLTRFFETQCIVDSMNLHGRGGGGGGIGGPVTHIINTTFYIASNSIHIKCALFLRINYRYPTHACSKIVYQSHVRSAACCSRKESKYM